MPGSEGAPETHYIDPYETGKEAARKAIQKLKLTGPSAASCSGGEYRRGFNEVINLAYKWVNP